jgi:hypothetical protein
MPATDNNKLLFIHEWLLTIPDYQQRSLFTHAQMVNQNEVELQCLATNKTIAKKWARNAKIHISRITIPIQYSSVFTEYEQLYGEHQHIEEWNPPPPPTLQFMPNPKQACKE